MQIVYAMLLLFLPILIQLLIGRKILKKNRKTMFVIISIFNILLLIIFTFISFTLTVRSISGSGNKCATSAVAIFQFGFMVAMLLLTIIIVQYFLNKKTNNIKKIMNHD